MPMMRGEMVALHAPLARRATSSSGNEVWGGRGWTQLLHPQPYEATIEGRHKGWVRANARLVSQ